MKEKKAKEVFNERIKCPHCSKRLVVKKTKKLLAPATKAEYEERLIVEKDKQQTLAESTGKKSVKEKVKPEEPIGKGVVVKGPDRAPAMTEDIVTIRARA